MKTYKSPVTLSASIFFLVLWTTMFVPGMARSEYPERAITVIVGMQAGGPVDLSTRAISVGAEKYLGQSIVIENRTGGAGAVGYSVVAASKPDGYRLSGGSSTGIIRAPQLLKVTTFKPLGSFTPIIGYASPVNALVVRKDAPWKNLAELIAYAKKNPGKIKYSSATIGSVMHHAMEYLAFKEGIKWVHIPQTGAAPAMTALLGGHVDACSAGSDFVPHAKSGAVRALALYESKRSPIFSDVPTLRELGYDFINEQVFGIFGPVGLPPEIVKKLEAAFTKGTETPEFKSTVERLYLTPVYYNSQDFDHFIKDLWPRVEKSLIETGIIKESATPPY